MTQAAAEAGVKRIYCEKAMACSLSDADFAKRAVEAAGTAFNTGVLRRFDERFRRARQMVAEGCVGRVQAVVHYAPATLVHGHIHSVDTILYLAGDPEVRSVWGELRPRELEVTDRFERDPLAVYHLELAGGIEATTIPAGNWEFEILGDEGVLRGMNNGAAWTLRRGQDEGGTFERIDVPSPKTSATVACLQDLIAAHDEKRPTTGHVGTAHRALEVCMAVAESHRQASRVTLPIAPRDLYVNHY
jgi:predicted dehydrogenase